jgi:hypothetical protein
MNCAMGKGLVDVLNSHNTVVHTFPIEIAVSDVAPEATDFEEKALQADARAELVADSDCTARGW